MAKKDPDIIEEFTVSGKEIVDSVKKRIDEIVRKNRATRVVVRDEKGETLLNVSIGTTVYVVAAAFVPAMIAGIVALTKRGSISVEFRKD